MLAPPPRALSRPKQKLLLVVALLAGIVEIGGLLEWLPRIPLGRLWLSPSIIPAAVLLVLLGRRAAGRARDVDAAAMYWVTAGFGVCLSMVLLDRQGHLTDSFALLLAALDEELVYRFAVPAVVTGVLLTFHVPTKPARIIGLVVAGTWFVLLPGHQEQVQTLADILPFASFAALSAVVVYRSGSLLATTATHAVMNMLTIISFGGEMSRLARSTATAVLLLLLLTGYGFVRPKRTESSSGDGETVIDLRDGVTPTVRQDGGAAVPVLEPAPVKVPAEDTRRHIG